MFTFDILATQGDACLGKIITASGAIHIPSFVPVGTLAIVGSVSADELREIGCQALIGIVQGGAYRDLRQRSAQFIAGLGFDGYAIGGSLGESKEEMYRVLEWTTPLLPREKSRHLLGIGEVEDIFSGRS
ncbi:MAG: tRNA-guanine transglycosylase [Deltaproteobacteria bacterium]|nr:tRNA-guanine transglycosylase [Deltaproteobacteria bacterium]